VSGQDAKAAWGRNNYAGMAIKMATGRERSPSNVEIRAGVSEARGRKRNSGGCRKTRTTASTDGGKWVKGSEASILRNRKKANGQRVVARRRRQRLNEKASEQEGVHMFCRGNETDGRIWRQLA